MSKTDIDWTQYTWNVVTGCTKVSRWCLHCYAERFANRFKSLYPNGFQEVTCHPGRLSLPLKMKKSQEIFVNSMSDLFHEEVPDAFLLRVFSVIKQTPRHIYQVLTKRLERMQEFMSKLWFEDDVALHWGDRTPYEGLENLWLGVSVEATDVASRIDRLRETPAKVRFLSCEPLLESLNEIDLTTGIDWVIVGGESGLYCRPIEREWVEEIYQRCITTNTPFFFKQWGGFRPKTNGRLFHGREWNQKPLSA
ncbi:MAG: phage Gp37/Gp68 family protein [Okeania sp. SIO3I5]|uniref:DUF5131 family protein n=1 Tax=Okeania sp. SIO3I5 TaxID=2607805 RepID=UPI0013B958B7|nr:phage Gp37/Gp68 family protein [Okeania sp. SIO3I5]NEQ41794.1 phage Gp37/Gp68 family protein [Okeania sp. SIO3I5]